MSICGALERFGMFIAIQPDYYGPNDASSPIWSRLLKEAGHEVREVNVYRADILDQLKECDGFMWRHAHVPHMRQVAKRLLPVIEGELGLVVYPDQKTCWHYDDKIAQAQLLEAAGIPTPKTWVWFDKVAALGWLQNAKYPIVLKLWTGAGSTNVRLVQSFAEAECWICRLFNRGVSSLEPRRFSLKDRILDVLRILFHGELEHPWELHKNYVLFQEFLADNEFDTRITVIGNRAFGYRRYNRPNDFRASGSGNFDVNPMYIDKETVKLAFDVAQQLGAQSVAIDGLKKGDRPVVGEISYTYVSWMVQACPGHWDSDLNWHDGSMWPEEAQVQDFLERLELTELKKLNGADCNGR